MKKHYSLLKIYSILYKDLGPQHWWPGETKLEIILGAILTQNTAWSNVEKALLNLKHKNLLSIKALNSISDAELSEAIRPAGFYNLKTGRIRNFMKFLGSRYGLSLKKMFSENTHSLRKELLSINGIGPETADSILLYAGEKCSFVVDNYTKRIFSRHGHIANGLDYEDIRNKFEANLPKSVNIYKEYHALIVEVGKRFCRSQKPFCKVCPIGR